MESLKEKFKHKNTDPLIQFHETSKSFLNFLCNHISKYIYLYTNFSKAKCARNKSIFSKISFPRHTSMCLVLLTEIVLHL